MEQHKPYQPQPLDVSSVTIPEELSELLEQLAHNVHETWASQRIAEGWRWGRERSDTLKTTPCLVPYEELPENEKEYDRITASQTIKLLLHLGYQIKSNVENSDSLSYQNTQPISQQKKV